MILLTMILMFLYTAIFQGRENLIWGLFAIPVLMIIAAGKWINSGSKTGIDVLRFDKDCRNFQFYKGNEVIAFRGEEAIFLKQENGDNYFEVRGIPLSFPMRVHSVGNFQTAIYLSGWSSNIDALTGRFTSKRAFFFKVGFENGVLKVWAETILGERIHT